MTGAGDVHVVPEVLSAASAATRALAEGVGGLGLAGPIVSAGAALPGSATAGQAAAMADRWRASITASAEAVARHASTLEQSAQSYRQSDRSISERLGAADAGTVGPATTGSGSIRQALN